jgi:hypothetical protein
MLLYPDAFISGALYAVPGAGFETLGGGTASNGPDPAKTELLDRPRQEKGDMEFPSRARFHGLRHLNLLALEHSWDESRRDQETE